MNARAYGDLVNAVARTLSRGNAELASMRGALEELAKREDLGGDLRGRIEELLEGGQRPGSSE